MSISTSILVVLLAVVGSTVILHIVINLSIAYYRFLGWALINSDFFAQTLKGPDSHLLGRWPRAGWRHASACAASLL